MSIVGLTIRNVRPPMLTLEIVVVVGLALLGVISLWALLNRRSGSAKHIGFWGVVASWGVGGSIGGLLAMLFLSYFGDEYFAASSTALKAVRLRTIAGVPAAYTTQWLALVVLLGGMVLGACLGWLLFNRWSRKRYDEENV